MSEYLVLCCILFSLGAFGVLIRRNILVMFMSIELMLNSVNLLLVYFSAIHNDQSGQVFVFFIMAVAAAEITIGLAILVMIFRHIGSIKIDSLKELKW
ncbi:MAG: NADH-quinone oxidoreductase subunit NuoK [Cytophaga sp.]|jgi:NADH-quinone oxidoreductase subunit K|uniref:NADH-quinone oxidoreductase subunit NuoK n=1 Tax=Cytophaga sp. TaxID=29535 RepID=UPI003F804297